jgi:hypothetical protein
MGHYIPIQGFSLHIWVNQSILIYLHSDKGFAGNMVCHIDPRPLLGIKYGPHGYGKIPFRKRTARILEP